MRFALNNAQRVEAQPGLSGICPGCGAPVIPKCGEVRIKNWAHVRNCECDSWHEPEGSWHRDWKSQFPESWQEIVHHAPSGERHIADIKTVRGYVIEFQHSPLRPDERRARDAFYPKLLWVVDATRRKSDAPILLRLWTEGIAPVRGHPSLRRVHAPDNAVMRDWAQCVAPVFLDVGNGNLIWIIPCRTEGSAYLLPMSCSQFVGIHREESSQALAIERQWTELPPQLAMLEEQLSLLQQRHSAFPRDGFQNVLARRTRGRRRF